MSKYEIRRKKLAAIMEQARKKKKMTFEDLGKSIGASKGGARRKVHDSNLTFDSLMELLDILDLEMEIRPKG